VGPLTVVLGCLARSVRDCARWYDVCAGFDSRDPYSLPRVDGWERNLDTYDLAGKRAVIAPTLGSAVVRPEVEELVREAGESLVKSAGLERVDAPVALPGLGFEWAVANLATLLVDLDGLWPACKDDLTVEMAFGMEMATQVMSLDIAAKVETARRTANEAMA